MTIAFFSNFLSHHQLPLVEEFNKIDGVNYIFVATEHISEERSKMGFDGYATEFLIDTTMSAENKECAMNLAVDADVAIFATTGVLDYEKKRLITGKLTFECGERWLKRGLINLLSPRLIKHQMLYYLYGRKAPLYMLCNSAFAAGDYYQMYSFRNRCYKWGYFTVVEEIDVEASTDVSTSNITPLMWCSRYLTLKHPELPIQLAAMLKKNGYRFVLDMYGTGERLDETKRLADKLQVNDVVRFFDKNVPNGQILQAMREHEIFLFTSDRNEGWGAVANESMSNGCALVASDEIGAVPFLVKDGINGMIFKSRDLQSLYAKVTYLLDNPDERKRMARQAVADMQNTWSPKVAATRFVDLVKRLQKGENTIYTEGPCSMALEI